LRIAYNIAVVEAGGHPLAFVRQDGALIGSIDLAIDKVFTADIGCGAGVFTSNLESFPGMIFVMLRNLDNPEGIKPVLEMFTKRHLKWAKPLDLRQFENTPS
jgi:hypothetical protein